MSEKITVTLTRAQWEELMHAVGNGYGDGDLYQLNCPARLRPKHWRRDSALLSKACDGVNAQLAHRPRASTAKTGEGSK